MNNPEFPTFLQALEKHMEASGDDVTTLAKRANVSRDALYKVVYRKTKTPSLEIIVKVAAAFGETVEEFMGLTPVQIRDDLLDEISRLTPSERAVLRASLIALRSRDDAEPAGTEPAEQPAQGKADL